MSEPFPWARIMHLGLGVLRLSPEQFWRTTLRELAGAFAPPPQTIDRFTLERLMREFPDP